jgi:ankyrin repeat protein
MKRTIVFAAFSAICLNGCNNYRWLYREVNFGDLQQIKEATTAIKDERELQRFKVFAFWAACSRGNPDIAQYLIEQGGINVNTPRVSEGPTPLHLALQLNHTEVMKVLLRNGADVNQETNAFHTPFMWAVRLGKPEYVTVLLAHNADINKVSNDVSALHIAAGSGNAGMLELLLDKGADVSINSDLGCRPLHIAAWCNRIEIAKILLEHGADPSLPCNGRTPLEIAHSEEFRKLLKRYEAD